MLLQLLVNWRWILFSDCPRDTRIAPSIACNAGTTLTCSTSCYPAASFLWVDNVIGEVVQHGPSIVLPLGKYDLTCMAYMYANCTNGYYSAVAFPDGVTTEGFPFDSLLSRTDNHTMQCSDNATISGYTIGECTNICTCLVILLDDFLFLGRPEHSYLLQRYTWVQISWNPTRPTPISTRPEPKQILDGPIPPQWRLWDIIFFILMGWFNKIGAKDIKRWAVWQKIMS